MSIYALSFMSMNNPFAAFYNPFNRAARFFGGQGFGSSVFSSAFSGNASRFHYKRTVMRNGGFPGNIFSNTKVNMNGINFTNANKNGLNFTGITNSSTGTRIGQLSGNGFSKTMISGNNIESVKHRTTMINSPFFRGTQSVTRVDHGDKIYNIKRTRGTSWVA